MASMNELDINELGRSVELAQTTGSPQETITRLQKRLSQNRAPSTKTQTGSWVNWGSEGKILGQPFDNTRIPLSKLEQMRRDPMLAFGLTFVKVPLMRAPWHIKSSDARRAAFIDNALRRIYGRLILAWTNSFDFGFSPIEKRFEYDTPDWTYVESDDAGALSGGSDSVKRVWPEGVQALVWKPFLALNPRHATPHWNADGDFAGIDYSKYGEGSLGSSFGGFPYLTGNSKGRPADIPLDWALWATNEKDSVFGSLWGYPRLGYSYRYWWSYWYNFGLADRAFEKWADPPVFVYYPTGSAALDEDGKIVDYSDAALAFAEQIRSGANGALPSVLIDTQTIDRISNVRAWEVIQMEVKTNFEAINQRFEYLDVQKLRSVMVPEQALVEGKGGTSSRNVAATFGDIFQESQAVVMEEIDDHINRYMIPQLLEANFGPGGASCTKVTTGFDPQDIETMRAIVQGIANVNPGNLPADLRALLRQLGVPLLSHAAFQKELDRQAEILKESQPPPKPATTGIGAAQSAGIEDGIYYQPREYIEIRLNQNDKAVLEKIMEEKEEDFKLTEQIAEESKELSGKFDQLNEKVDKINEKEPIINVSVDIPEQKLSNSKTRSVVVRDENDNILYVDRIPIEEQED